ncbi:MAG: DUF3306 domain-containing protein [Burkholderiales bacterium]
MQNSDDDKKPFLSRWSRRKLQAEQEKASTDLPAADVAKAASVVSADAKAVNVKPEALPTIDSVNLESGVAPFFKQQADESLRRLALKKLLSDPHFNIMDGLDIYVGDYSQPDPIPPEMMKKIRHARQWAMTPEEIVEAEKVDVEEELALKLAREEGRAQEEMLALEQAQVQQNIQQNQLDNLAAPELNVPSQNAKK